MKPCARCGIASAPTQDLPVALRDPETGERRLEPLRWGLIPYWAKDAKVAYSTINAMAETVATMPAFRDAMRVPGTASRRVPRSLSALIAE
jgi:putative SOS response-associated peptidase YedK